MFKIFVIQFELHLHSYSKCWKCSQCSAAQVSTLFLKLLANVWRVPAVTFRV